ncbi:LamB/YcsF family protein [Corynebacterium ciconiae DSM 44920]|uniref:LamB/YcsF family protein n=1 Tax=Corynebacterium ciconiae TaxID=227319 RepID=UPI00036DE451|nr:5-oxoprolinase subunit PxpA [Corynebacterium ciconiae]WKD61538.1 LamB/YcsF family protein [Corynebacterium ciconiae DSM 44920]
MHHCPTIDLNADLGESFGHYQVGDDSALLEIISSANVACGVHAGDPEVLLHTLRLAADKKVRVGAHPGYRDLQGFGRRAMAYTPEQLYAELVYQIGAVQAAATAVGIEVEYVKPHGAMYNTIAIDKPLADAVCAAVRDVDSSLALMCLAGAPITQWAMDAGLSVIREAFADRRYTPDARLAPRGTAGAVITDPAAASAQATAIAAGQPIRAIDGSEIHIEADSLCVHGDSPAAVALARCIRRSIEDAGMQVRA